MVWETSPLSAVRRMVSAPAVVTKPSRSYAKFSGEPPFTVSAVFQKLWSYARATVPATGPLQASEVVSPPGPVECFAAGNGCRDQISGGGFVWVADGLAHFCPTMRGLFVARDARPA